MGTAGAPAGRLLAAALAGLVLAGALAATPAAAGVSIGPERIEVTGPGAGAIIERDPLRITYTDGERRPVLSGLGGAEGASRTVPGLPRTQFGAPGPVPPTLYRPFAFLVGSTSITQIPAQQWQGNLNTVTEGGTEYGAVAVESARRAGRGVRLTLSTSDPSGRKLIATLKPGPERGAISVSAVPDPAAGVAAISDSFSARPGEAFRGFGGRHNALDQRGTEFYNHLQQENLSSGRANALTAPTSGDDFLFPNGAHAAYYVQSSFLSPGRYGFLLDRDEISHWRMASDRDDAWQVQAASRRLDYVVAPGKARRSIRTLTAISGRQMVPPRWALGPILDRAVIFNDDTPDKYEAEVRQDLVDIDRYGIHPKAYRIEGWQFLPDDVLADLIAELKERRIKPMLYFRAFVGEDEIGTDDPAAYDEAIAKGYVATKPGGGPYTWISNFSANGAQIDFTDPEAVKWWQGRIKAGLRLGAEGFMQDFGEQVMSDMRFADGSTGRTMHNRLVVLYHRATREAVREFERNHPGRHIFYFTRAGYSGTPGSAKYEFANFPGDETTDWTRSAGLASQTPDMLNRGIGGAYGYTTDIGGFFDVGPYEPTTKELFIRWAEWAALSPMFRLHGSVGAGPHMPWTYDAETVRRYKRLAELHRRAVPLIHDLWKRAHATGIPIARPMWLQFPGDPEAVEQDQQWMLGPDLLVAPVVAEGATKRRVYFPAGCWQDRGGTRFRGPGYETVAAPLSTLPFFERCGTTPLAPPRDGGKGAGRPAGESSARGTPFRGTVSRLSAKARERMTGVSWHEGCPVGLGKLRMLGVSYIDFHGNPDHGRLIVHEDYAGEIVKVFERLYEKRFPIRRLEPIDRYRGDDHRSMAADNTSAFNCRVVNGTDRWSRHAYGRAIDINPRENPYVTSSGFVSPPEGAPYADRDDVRKGMIVAKGPVVRSMRRIAGWKWGGKWDGTKDFQHFSNDGR